MFLSFHCPDYLEVGEGNLVKNKYVIFTPEDRQTDFLIQKSVLLTPQINSRQIWNLRMRVIVDFRRVLGPAKSNKY